MKYTNAVPFTQSSQTAQTIFTIDGETVETVADFIFLGSQITADGDYSHEIKRRLRGGVKMAEE